MDINEYLDLHKKYSGTYIRAKEKEKADWITIYVESIICNSNPDRDGYTFLVEAAYNGEITKLPSTHYDFDFSFPPVGVLNFKNTVVIANKYPARQWKKAVTNENYRVYLPLLDLIKIIENDFITPRNAFTRTINWNTKDINEFFNSKYFSYKEALSLVQNNTRNAAAISEQFFITNSYYGLGWLIWRYNNVVAEVSEDLEINFVSTLFKQELQDYFARSINA